MRTMILALAILAAVAVTALAQSTAPPQVATLEQGVARPGGVYMTVPAATPNACAEACAADGLCMSWTFQSDPPQRCELKAVIPHPVRDPLAVSGLAARAPAFARLVAPREIGPPRDLAEPPHTQVASAPLPPEPRPEPRPEPGPEPRPEPGPEPGPAPAREPADLDAPETTRDEPALPPRPPEDAPILLSADTAPLPLRDRAARP
jgi:PAN domain